MSGQYVGLAQARALTAASVRPLAPRALPLLELAGLVAGGQARARVASPTHTASSKDGYAVRGADLAQAGPDSPVALELVGRAVAGQPADRGVGPGQALAVTTGTVLPVGADAVLASEFARAEGGMVLALGTAEPGRNLLREGADVTPGQTVLSPGQVITPALVGLLAAAGLAEALAHPRPRVGILATGREVVAPGHALPPGSVYASNLVSQAAWLSLHGLPLASRVVDDQAGAITEAAGELLASCDILLTSGGAWTGERDLVLAALAELGFAQVFRRVRMGPGKGVALGLVGDKPVFCLPGGPPSNDMAFLQLALPACLALAGHPDPGLREVSARLEGELSGQAEWTQFWHGRLEQDGAATVFRPLPFAGRLRTTAGSQAIARLPEGVERLGPGDAVAVQALGPAFARDGLW
jgi:molybdopterin molybdotransferase